MINIKLENPHHHTLYLAKCWIWDTAFNITSILIFPSRHFRMRKLLFFTDKEYVKNSKQLKMGAYNYLQIFLPCVVVTCLMLGTSVRSKFSPLGIYKVGTVTKFKGRWQMLIEQLKLKCNVTACPACFWLRIGTAGVLLWSLQTSFRRLKMWPISWPLTNSRLTMKDSEPLRQISLHFRHTLSSLKVPWNAFRSL
jgi:hypothetical protein